MPRDDDLVLKLSGLTARELAYLHTQPGIRAPGDAWDALTATQAVLFGAIHHTVEDRSAFAACRYIAEIVRIADNDLDVLGDLFLVVRGTTCAFVHNATEIPDVDTHGRVTMVVDLDDIRDAVAEVVS